MHKHCETFLKMKINYSILIDIQENDEMNMIRRNSLSLSHIDYDKQNKIDTHLHYAEKNVLSKSVSFSLHKLSNELESFKTRE